VCMEIFCVTKIYIADKIDSRYFIVNLSYRSYFIVSLVYYPKHVPVMVCQV
jgi:hypothetical protein